MCEFSIDRAFAKFDLPTLVRKQHNLLYSPSTNRGPLDIGCFCLLGYAYSDFSPSSIRGEVGINQDVQNGMQRGDISVALCLPPLRREYLD